MAVPGGVVAIMTADGLGRGSVGSSESAVASRPRVFVAREIMPNGLELLRTSCDVDMWTERLPAPRAELLRRVAGCAGVVAMMSERIDAEFFDAAGPQLKVVANYAVGYDNVDVPEATRRGVWIGNTPGALTDATADVAAALLLAAARKLPASRAVIDAGEWKCWEPMGYLGQDLVGKTIGIVGMGRIGYALARRFHRGWDMPVLYYGRSPHREAEQTLQARKVSFEELLRESDVISVHCSLTPQTRGMFGREQFRQMKPTAIFINTARGEHHVQPDLAAALEAGEIAAAGLDVTSPEPIPLDDPLLRLPNCVITPHIGSATVATRTLMAEIAAQNVLNCLAGRPLRHAVNQLPVAPQ